MNKLGLVNNDTVCGKINEYTYQKGIFNDFKDFIKMRGKEYYESIGPILTKITSGEDKKILYAHMKREYGVDVEKAYEILSEMEE